MILALIVSVLALGVMCALLYNLVIYATPVFVGLDVGVWALHSGAGTLGAILVGFVVAVLTLAIGQAVFASSRSPLIRWVTALLFAVPATYAAYTVISNITESAVPSHAWRFVIAGIAAVIVGCTAVARLGVPAANSRSHMLRHV